jgi:hypothetical protein
LVSSATKSGVARPTPAMLVAEIRLYASPFISKRHGTIAEQPAQRPPQLAR